MLTFVSLGLLACTALLLFVMFQIARPLFADFALSRNVDATIGRSVGASLPPAAVILCVRGADPTLPACLDGLMRQSHPDFEVHIVLDSELDPAAEFVNAAIDRHSVRNVHRHILNNPDPRRGLKVSAILQALGSLRDEVAVIAFLDADAEPGPDWLANLVGPLQLPGVGATSGARWFDPETRNVGSLVRAKWNLYAVVLMRCFSITWGGSFAIRREVLDRSRLIERWTESVCEDTCVGDTLAEAGYRVQQVPEVAMINRETTCSRGCYRFMRRQLVFTRLHSQKWLPILAFGLALSILAIALPVHAAVAWFQSDDIACAIALVALAGLNVGATLFELRTASLASSRLRVSTTGQALAAGLRLPVVIVTNYPCQIMTVVVSGLAFVAATFARRLQWRGITYRLHRSQVRLVRYLPFTPASDVEVSRMSI